MKNARLFLLLGMLTLSAIAFTGCSNSNVNGGYYAWYDVYGNVCSNGTPYPGCNYYADGAKIRVEMDPWYGLFIMYQGNQGYYDSYGYWHQYYGWTWWSPDGILYTDSGWALNASGQSEGRDLISDIAAREQSKVEEAGKVFAEKNGLSEDKGLLIATTLNDLATLGKRGKARTEAEYDRIAAKLFGIDAASGRRALADAQKGDNSSLEKVNEQIAEYWGTSSETSREIATRWAHGAIQLSKP